MTWQPAPSIPLASQPSSWRRPVSCPSIPGCCLPISFSVCLVFSLLALCPAGLSWQALKILLRDIVYTGNNVDVPTSDVAFTGVPSIKGFVSPVLSRTRNSNNYPLTRGSFRRTLPRKQLRFYVALTITYRVYFTHAYAHTRARTHARTHTRTHARTRARAHTHTHTHTHTYTRKFFLSRLSFK